MKHKKIFVNACEASPGNPSGVCSRLRFNHAGELEVLPSPTIAAEGEWRPLLCLHHHPDGPLHLLTATSPDPSGKYPIAISQLSGASPSIFGSLDSCPLCAAPTDGGAIIMTDSGPHHIVFSGDTATSPTLIGAMPPVRPVILEAELRGSMTMTIAPMRFTGCDFSSATPLSQSDHSRLSAALADAYSDTVARASAAGLWIQPVVAFYRLRRADGGLIYTSAPKIISAPGGWQATSGFATACDVSGDADNRTASIPAMAISLDTFRIKATIPPDILPGAWGEMVATVEICVSPQLHPIDFSDRAAYLFTGGAAATTFTVALPGATSQMASLDIRRRSATLEVVARAAEACSVAATFRYAVEAGGSAAVIHPCPQTAREDCAAIKSILNKSATAAADITTPTLLRDITAPHSFAAATVAIDGDSAVWGDITPLPFAGYTPQEFVSASDSDATEEWDALSIVTLTDGRQLTALTSGMGNRPVSVGPLIGYPSPDARKIDIWVRKSTSVYKATVNLFPDPLRRGAWHLETGLAKIALEATAEPMPDVGTATSPGLRHQGFLASAPAVSPLSVTGCQMCSDAAIKAIVAASRSLSSWDFSRSHLHVFTPAGIYAVAVNASNRIASASLIAARGVSSATAVTPTRQGTLVLPPDGGYALMIKASRAETVILPGSFTACAHHNPSGDTWLMTPSGELTVMTPHGFVSSGLSADALYGCGGTPLILSTDGDLLRPGSTSTGPIAVEWKTQISIEGRRAVTEAVWFVQASSFDGTLSVRAHGGAGETYPLAVCEVFGQINSPVALHIVAPSRPYITLELNATVSADFTFRGISLTLSKPLPL